MTGFTTRPTRERLATLLAVITRCANEGRPCPSNSDIAIALGLESGGAAADYVKRLEARGDVTVERFAASRIVTIVATGKRTAGEAGSTHWRNRDAAVAPKVKAKRTDRAPEPAPVLRVDPIRVDREPCPRCAVRADIGCEHSRRGAPALSLTSFHR